MLRVALVESNYAIVKADAGYGEIRPGGADSESGALDLDLWGKLQLIRTADGKWDVAAGALMKLPTGDDDAGLLGCLARCLGLRRESVRASL